MDQCLEEVEDVLVISSPLVFFHLSSHLGYHAFYLTVNLLCDSLKHLISAWILISSLLMLPDLFIKVSLLQLLKYPPQLSDFIVAPLGLSYLALQNACVLGQSTQA